MAKRLNTRDVLDFVISVLEYITIGVVVLVALVMRVVRQGHFVR